MKHPQTERSLYNGMYYPNRRSASHTSAPKHSCQQLVGNDAAREHAHHHQARPAARDDLQLHQCTQC